MTVTKEKITAMLSSKLGLSNSLCEEIVNAIFSNILETAFTEKLTLKNFGSFEISEKKPRPGINFHTKLPVTIESKRILRFTPSANLKTLINESSEKNVSKKDTGKNI
ncbi:HU family DNA-binding protein [Rickettsia endosymbiont of Orchestes rusci]|uniref:HU family DNA-binding protein n=1 Tax=Rickettsia endosymbiont of Orchestes rusci TaxID=3066250 RepID=UPI00209DEA24|nr:HU family DNA-binding protein [Rickettsia endosymbiont of Ceutorhynchus assimilis]